MGCGGDEKVGRVSLLLSGTGDVGVGRELKFELDAGGKNERRGAVRHRANQVGLSSRKSRGQPYQSP